MGLINIFNRKKKNEDIELSKNIKELELLVNDDIAESDQETGSKNIKNNVLHEQEATTASIYERGGTNILFGRFDRLDSGQLDDECLQKAKALNAVLCKHGVNANIVNIVQGPVYTRFEIVPGVGVSISSIKALKNEIRDILDSQDIQIIVPIPNKNAVGIDVQNKSSSIFDLRYVTQISESEPYFVYGRDAVSSDIIYKNINSMSSVLIAGIIGAGKTTHIKANLLNIAATYSSQLVRFVIINIGEENYKIFNGIKHMLSPIISDVNKIEKTINKILSEADKRLSMFESINVKNIVEYNLKVINDNANVNVNVIPSIICVIDDLIYCKELNKSEIERKIIKLVQMSECSGIHIILSTSDVGLRTLSPSFRMCIKDKIVMRQKNCDASRLIIHSGQAEKLRGYGDEYIVMSDEHNMRRAQGMYVDKKAISEIVPLLYEMDANAYLNSVWVENNNSDVADKKLFMEASTNIYAKNNVFDTSEFDIYFKDACRLVVEKEKVTAGMLQRVYKIGFDRAMKIVDQMEKVGIVGPEEELKPRRVLISREEAERILEKI